MGLINTVLGYKKGSKTKNIFSILENIMFQLSNALSIVFISLKLVKLRQIKVFSVAPAKGPETLPVNITHNIIMLLDQKVIKYANFSSGKDLRLLNLFDIQI